jgi:hypothetical protein
LILIKFYSANVGLSRLHFAIISLIIGDNYMPGIQVIKNIVLHIQGVSGGIVNILRGGIMDYSE